MVMETFLKGDRVRNKDNYGFVRNISNYGVHVKWDDGMYQVFHFLPTHHKQTPIGELEKIKTQQSKK